jgi:hypothetical protein
MGTKDLEKRKIYDRRYREKHRDEVNARIRNYRAANPTKRARQCRYDKNGEVRRCVIEGYRQKNREDRARRRRALLLLLGNVCVKCGFADPRALCIDHVNGGGCAERKSFSNLQKYYQSILDRNGIGYQLLCCNCNAIKRIENREYPDSRKYK